MLPIIVGLHLLPMNSVTSLTASLLEYSKESGISKPAGSRLHGLPGRLLLVMASIAASNSGNAFSCRLPRIARRQNAYLMQRTDRFVEPADG
ncbi:MAG: hypothetical protein HKP32_00290 [Woeseia sp.]|nr:hypothetical protein [Woeseia sp.]NNL53569.1 hypothetical protein [Woeseia sp.]